MMKQRREEEEEEERYKRFFRCCLPPEIYGLLGFIHGLSYQNKLKAHVLVFENCSSPICFFSFSSTWVKSR